MDRGRQVAKANASVAPEAGAAGKGRAGVQSVEIGIRIVGAIAEAGQPLMLRDIAKAVGMPAAKVHRYLVSLIRQEMVEQDSFGGRYWLGPFALRVGLSALRQLDVVRMASEAIADLRDRTDHTAILSVYGSAGPTIVRWEECRHPTAVNAHVGSVLSLLDSATGRVFAAFLPPHLVEDRIRAEAGDRDPAAIRKLLSDVRTRGMSLVRGSELASINAMGAPVFDHADNLVAAITLMGSRRTFDVAWNNAMARELVACARRVSQRLGHEDHPAPVAAWPR
ncbi:MAG TPA: IclR family transcriptional regulator [Burkholderiaceae bacterium]|jgi:DNA-binding IclR family transcriptional regulator|nr:IclR family transcriptional regulator [Burkholderiaceae bacterium]